MQPPLGWAFQLSKCDADILLGLLRVGADTYVRSKPAWDSLARSLSVDDSTALMEQLEISRKSHVQPSRRPDKIFEAEDDEQTKAIK
jgi:hypothetical protein